MNEKNTKLIGVLISIPIIAAVMLVMIKMVGFLITLGVIGLTAIVLFVVLLGLEEDESEKCKPRVSEVEIPEYYLRRSYIGTRNSNEDSKSNDDVRRQEQSHRDRSNSHNPNNSAFRHRMNQKSNAHNPCDSAYWESRQQSYRDRHRNQSNRNNPNNPQYRKH